MQEEHHSGIPTRAIHEAYLEMQGALKSHRRAKERGDSHALDSAHADVQESVLTFYELLRPHLKSNDGVSDWWEGKLPAYKRDGTACDPESGRGILQVQQKTDSFDVSDLANREDWSKPIQKIQYFDEWHDLLQMNGNTRITNVLLNETMNGDKIALIGYQAYQIGLRHLDDWGTQFKTVDEDLGGFYEHKNSTRTERVRVDMPRLQRAARELSDVAEKLGALSQFDASEKRTDMNRELLDKVEEWQQENLRT